MAHGLRHQDPHPLIEPRYPTLYVRSTPWGMKREDVQRIFTDALRGAEVVVKKQAQPTRASGDDRRRTVWILTFRKAMHAEQIIATMNNTSVDIRSNPELLSISHSPTFEPTRESTVHPIYISGHELSDTLAGADIHKLFTWFRVAGPIVSLTAHVDVGNRRATVIQYWHQRNADHAVRSGPRLHSGLKKEYSISPFGLRTFDPRMVRCSINGLALTSTHLEKLLMPLNSVRSASLLPSENVEVHGLITFSNKPHASQALDIFKNSTLKGMRINAQFYELENPAHRDKIGAQSNLGQDSTPEPIRRVAEAERALIQAEQALLLSSQRAIDAREAEVACEANVEHTQQQMQELIESIAEYDRILPMVKGEWISLASKRGRLQQSSVTTSSALELVDREVARVKQRWYSLRSLRDEEARQVDRVQDAVERVRQELRRLRSLHTKSHEAIEAAREAKRIAQQAVHDAKKAYDAWRGPELAEAIRRMREIYQAEQAEAEQAKQEKLRAEEEAKRQQEEERQRLQTEQERREEEDRRRMDDYAEAAATERLRCQERDRHILRGTRLWTTGVAIMRFKAVWDDFERIRFCDARPLTFESVPWPVLTVPHSIAQHDFQWADVETFFGEVRRSTNMEEYKTLLLKTQRGFHPDKWAAGFNSVLDGPLRERLQTACNVVSQAVTSILMELRSS